VWTEQVVVRVPFTLAADAPDALEVGATVTFSACDESGCRDPQRSAPVVAAVRRAKAPAPAAPAPPAPPPEVPAMDPVPAPPAPGGAVPAPSPPRPAAAPSGALGEIRKEHNVDLGDKRLAVRLTVPADVAGLRGESVGVDVAFYDERGVAIRSALPLYGDAQGSLRVASRTAAVDADPDALSFVFLVPYAAFPSRGAAYAVEARASLSTRAATREAAKFLATRSTKFTVE
jgi:hypothetical protein